VRILTYTFRMVYEVITILPRNERYWIASPEGRWRVGVYETLSEDRNISWAEERWLNEAESGPYGQCLSSRTLISRYVPGAVVVET